MKVALVYIPKTAVNQVNVQAYLRACIERAKQDDCTILTPCNYTVYAQLATKEYFNSIQCAVNVIYLFTDYGTDVLMTALINQYSLPDSPIEIQIKNFTAEELRTFRDNTANILSEVADRSNIPVELLISKTRIGEVVKYRQFYCLRAREKTNDSLSKIGSLIGKDHATVLHAIKTVRTTKLSDGGTLLEEYEAFFACKPKKIKQDPEPEPEPKKETPKQPEPVKQKPDRFIKALEFSGPYMGYKIHSR